MKNLFLLSLAAACVCACAQNASSEAAYEWEGVKLSYDSARYEGERFGSGEVEGLFAAKGYKQCRAVMRAEAPDEDAMWGMLSLFEDVRFNVD